MSGIIISNKVTQVEDVVYIITGGGSGLGKALAQTLALRGKSVLITGRREQALRDTAASSSLITYLCVDVATESGRKAIADCVAKMPTISALINNAGTIEPMVPVLDLPPHAWHHLMHTNLDAALFLPQLLYNQLAHGRVLNIGSGAAYFPVKGWSAYCVSKAALAMLTRCWQLESETVAFASVMPGIVDTDMQAIIRHGAHMDPEKVAFFHELQAQHKLVSPETAAAFFAWLLLDTDSAVYSAKEWDIYDTSHHHYWLRPPHQVPHWEQ